MSELLRIENLSKRYNTVKAVDDVSLTINSGRIIGLIGPNGCGKSTLMKSIVGLMNDYTGKILIDGMEPGIETKKIISYLPEATYLAPRLRPIDVIEIFNDFYPDFDEAKARELLERFDLSVKMPLKAMSKGMQEKVQLIFVMSRNAKLYILDEPLSGVDPASRETILEIILKNYAENASLMLSTHLIQDVERIFDDVIIMGKGKIIKSGDSDDIRESVGMSLNDYFKEVFKC